MKNAALLHLIFASLVLIIYGVLTALGYDASELFGLLVGQAAGAGISRVGT